MSVTTSLFLQQVSRLAAMLMPPPLCRPLRAAQAELSRGLHLAFRLASIHNRAVVLEPFRQATKGRISLRLPAGVRWGRPAAVPLHRTSWTAAGGAAARGPSPSCRSIGPWRMSGSSITAGKRSVSD